MQKCNQCGFKFHLLSQRFYCCDSSKPVCSVCRRKVCKNCQKPRTQEIVIPRCDKCYSRLYENDLLFQYNCQRYFCAKCLSGLFKDAYNKVTLDKMFDKNREIFVKFTCGHQYPYEQLVGFFQHFCLCCGRQYDSALDYEFEDGVKLCFMCYRYFGKDYQSVLIHCEACQCVIKNSSQATIFQGTDIPICQKCSFESKLQQNIITKSRTKMTVVQPSQVKKDSFVKSMPTKEQQKPPKIQQPKQQSPKKKQDSSPKPLKNPLSKLLKKPSISQLKKKQQKRVLADKSNSVSVTSRFSNNFEDIDEQTTKSLGLTQNIKLKRHLSNQTYVQQYKIQVPQNVQSDFVKCKRCHASILLGQAYNLYDGGSKLNGKKSIIVDFSQIKKLSSSIQESSYFICRVCYSKSAQRQKSILSISGVKSRMEMSNNRPSKLDESNADFLKVPKSNMRQNRSPSPSPNDKQYSLTGSRVQLGQKSNINITKQSLLSSVQSSSNKPVEKQYTKPLIHPVSTESRQTMSNNPSRFMKCDACRDVKRSLIATINQGYLCDQCYYLKNPTSSFFNRRT